MIASGNHTIICAAPVRTLGLRGSELSRSDNPSVMALRETAMTAPFTQGEPLGAPAPVRLSIVQCHMLSDIPWEKRLIVR